MVGLTQSHQEEEQLLCNQPSQRLSHEQSGYLPSFFPWCFIPPVTASQLSFESKAMQSFFLERAYSCNVPLYCLLAAAESPPCLRELATAVPKLCQ